MWVHVYASVDVDVGIFCMFFFVFASFFSGDSFVISVLEHEYWAVISRPYFSFLVMINWICYYVFYQTESRVKIEIFNIVFFATLIGILMVVVNMLSFVFIEIPLKKVNKMFVVKGNGRRKKFSSVIPPYYYGSGNLK